VQRGPVGCRNCLFVCLFVCLFGGVAKAGEIRTLLKTSLLVAVLRVAKGLKRLCLHKPS
jgi:hypothetical protein